MTKKKRRFERTRSDIGLLTSFNRAKRVLPSAAWASIFFVGFVLATIFFESHELADSSGTSCVDVSSDASPPFYNSLYKSLLNWMVSNRTASEVREIVIKGDLADIQQNVCLGRTYMADLITSLSKQSPSVIVIDKFFSPSSCRTEPQATTALIDAVRSARIPVIVGESTDLTEVEVDGSCLVHKDQLSFGVSNVKTGLTKLNSNKEQIPLSWAVLPYPPETYAGQVQLKSTSMNTISFVAAAAFDPDLAKMENFQSYWLKWNLFHARQPYAWFNQEELPSETSTALLCSSNPADDVKTRWSLDCSRTQPTVDLLGKVVVIGTEMDSDRWVVLGRRLFGFQLQARYVDSLLSGKYVRAAPGVVPLGIFAVFLLLLEGVPFFAHFRHRAKEVQPAPFWTPQLRWALFLSLISPPLTTFGFIYFHYLPPLLVLFMMVLALVTRVIVRGLEYTYDRIESPKEKSPA